MRTWKGHICGGQWAMYCVIVAMGCVSNRTGLRGQFLTKVKKQSFEPFFCKTLKPV